MEYKEVISIQPEEQEEKKEHTKKKNSEDSISSLWDNFKCSNICIIEVPEGEEKDQKKNGSLFQKIMKENFPNLVKEIYIQVQEAQSILNKLDPKRTTPRYIIIKMPKVKDRESKSSKRKEESYLQRSTYKTIS